MLAERLTNDLRYDSKDSREIENGSLSLNILRWLDDDEVVLCQKLFFSGGDGCRKIISVLPCKAHHERLQTGR